MVVGFGPRDGRRAEHRQQRKREHCPADAVGWRGGHGFLLLQSRAGGGATWPASTCAWPSPKAA